MIASAVTVKWLLTVVYLGIQPNTTPIFKAYNGKSELYLTQAECHEAGQSIRRRIKSGQIIVHCFKTKNTGD